MYKTKQGFQSSARAFSEIGHHKDHKPLLPQQ